MQLGVYELTAEIGRGGMGTVFKARAPDGSLVAVKLLHHPGGGSALARFDRERRLMTSLGEAEGFVPLLDAGDSPRGPFLVMPLVTGGTLRDRLRRGPLPAEETLALGRALAAALAAAHALGIVHRDLKPENVLFDDRGRESGAARPLVADLGLAKHFSLDAPGASQSAALTRSGQFAGTAGYAPLEQIQDARDAKPSCDVFSLGVVLYECLTGRLPFVAPNVMELMSAIEAGTFPAVESLRPGTPRPLTAVIERALARDPASRFQDAAAMRAALEPAAEGAPAAARRWRSVAVVLGATAAATLLASVSLSVSPAPTVTPKVLVAPTPGGGAAAKLRESADRRIAMGDEKGAVLDLTRALALDDEDAVAWRLRGSLRVNAHDPEGAIADLTRALALDPRDSQAWCNRAAARLNRNELDLAASDAERAIQLSPGYAKAWSTLAIARDRRGDLAVAIEAYSKALALDAANVEAWHGRGLAREKRGDVKGAISDLERSCALDARRAPLWFNLGTVRRNHGLYDAAIDALSRAIELEPADAPSWRSRGAAKLQRGDPDAALDDLAEALRLDPRAAEAWNLRGLCRGSKRDFGAAIADVTRAIDLNPRVGSFWKNRGVLREKGGDHEGAIADMRRFLELEPDDPSAPSIRATLEANDRLGR